MCMTAFIWIAARAWPRSAIKSSAFRAYDPDQHGSAPFGWHRDFADPRKRIHDWVATSGTRLERDHPIREVAWPGEAPLGAGEDVPITDRDADFIHFLVDDVARRRDAESTFRARAAPG